MAGDQRRTVALALSDVMQALCELLDRVAKHKLQIKLLGDAEERFEPVDLHAHANHHDAGPSRRAVHDLLDDSGNTHAFEDHRRTPLRAASHELSIAAAVVAFGRRHIMPGLVRRDLGRIDHDVSPMRSASARRAGEKSAAMIGWTFLIERPAITAMPAGPHPITSATSSGVNRACCTA